MLRLQRDPVEVEDQLQFLRGVQIGIARIIELHLQLPEQVRRRKVLRGKFLGAVGDQADPPVVRTQAAQQQRVFLVRLFGENDELCRNHINPVVS